MTTTAAATTKTKKRKARITTFDVVVYFILIALMILMLYPLLFVVSASFSDPKMVAAGKMLLLPVEPNLDGYKYIFQYKEIWTGYLNTIFYTFFGTVLNLAATMPCAYALSRKDLRGRGIIMIFFMIPMYFSGGMIPGYLNVKSLGLLDTRAMILVNGLVSTYNLIVCRTYFQTAIPYELQEAAVIDGCDDFQIFTKIYLKDRGKFPLQLFLREILTKSTFAKQAMINGQSFSAEEMMALIKQADTANMIKYGVIVISTLPMMMIYPFLQKYFEKGIMIGSVKG